MMPLTHPLVSGFLNVDVVIFSDCPKCYQSAGKVCVNDRGRRLSVPHAERQVVYEGEYPDRKKLYEGRDWRIKRSAVEEYNLKLKR